MAGESDAVERCDNCRFWAHDGNEYIGQCRKRPPVIVPSMISEGDDGTDLDVYCATFFPVADASDWCGEYQRCVSRVE